MVRWQSGAHVISDEPKMDGSFCHPKFNEKKDWILSEENRKPGKKKTKYFSFDRIKRCNYID